MKMAPHRRRRAVALARATSPEALANGRASVRGHKLEGVPSIITDTKSVVKFVWTHPANEGARARALLRAASYQTRARLLHRRTLARLGHRSSMWADLHRTAASKVVYANPPDHPEMLAWRQVLRRGDLFLDVGANIGSYAIWAGEIGAEVIALEPAEDTLALLEENVALNSYPIMTIQAAAGATTGTARFTSGRDTVNRLDSRGSVETTMVTIDSIVGNRTAAGMKVDVEGFEIDVLRGCEQALAEHRLKLIQLEWNSTSRGSRRDRSPTCCRFASWAWIQSLQARPFWNARAAKRH